MNVSIDTHPGQGVSVEVMVDLVLEKLPADLSGQDGGIRSVIFCTSAIGMAEEVVVNGFTKLSDEDIARFREKLHERMQARGARHTRVVHHEKNGPNAWGVVVVWASEETPTILCFRDGLGKLAAQMQLAALGGVTN